MKENSNKALTSKVDVISHHRLFNRNLKRAELIGEIKNLVEEERYEDFIFIAEGSNGRAVRIGSDDLDLRYGDLIWMLDGAKKDVLESK